MNWVLPALFCTLIVYKNQAAHCTNHYLGDIGGFCYVAIYLYYGYSKVRGIIRGQERYSYECIPIIGNIAFMIFMYKNLMPVDTISEEYISYSYLMKFSMLPLVMALIASKVYSLICETETYAKGEKGRAERARKAQESDLDRDIDRCAKGMANANSYEDRRYWEAELEKAKARREKYYFKKNKM